MPAPRQYYDKAHSRILIGADAAELFAASIDTTTPHPPHPHAHLSRDGFAHARVTRENALDPRRAQLVVLPGMLSGG